MEYSVLIVKPNKCFHDLCRFIEIKLDYVEGLTIYKKNILRLNQNQIMHSFTTKIDRNDYAQYMMSGEIAAYLISGDYAIEKVKSLKKEIRSVFSVKKSDLFNVVHSTDEGLEYFYQFTECFPELNIEYFSGYADLDI